MKQKQKPRSGGFAKQTVFVNANMKKTEAAKRRVCEANSFCECKHEKTEAAKRRVCEANGFCEWKVFLNET